MTVSHTSGAGNDRPGNKAGTLADPAAPAHAGSPAPIARLRKRSEFLRVAKGARFHTKGFSLQSAAGERPEGPAHVSGSRFGFTVTRKVGTSVERNRMRRRLREALRQASHLAPDLASKPGHDYVIIARREALHLPFAGLIRDLQTAIVRIGAKDGRKQPK